MRLIYRLFLDGKTQSAICNQLEKLGIPSPGGKQAWSRTTVTSILKNEKYKGDALLQKTFTVDFLEKKKKPNEGEVPQYYVENSHPPIITPDEWELVQAEFIRRESIGKAYSGTSVLASKLICEDCGGFYGSKVWHSTDQYRRTIWQCNRKFKHEQRCLTPTLDSKTVQTLFLKAYNELMKGRRRIIADCEMMRKALTDFKSLDDDIAQQQEEVRVVSQMVEAPVKENASTAQSQETYQKKYDALSERYAAAAQELDRLQTLHTQRRQQDKAMALFIRTLKKQPEVLSTWDDTVWTVMVKEATVHRDKSITFSFSNGKEITVK